MGARRATCRTARFSVMLIFSPSEHGVDPRSQAGFLGQFDEQLEGFVGDAVLRVIQEEAHSLGRHPLAALGVIREEISQMQFPDLLVVGLEGLPGLAFGQRFDSLAFGTCSYRCCHVRTPFVSCLLLRTGLCEHSACSHRRNPPRNALALSPARQPGGSSFSFLTLPPPRHHVVGLEGGDQAGNHVRDMQPPFLFPPLL